MDRIDWQDRSREGSRQNLRRKAVSLPGVERGRWQSLAVDTICNRDPDRAENDPAGASHDGTQQPDRVAA